MRQFFYGGCRAEGRRFTVDGVECLANAETLRRPLTSVRSDLDVIGRLVMEQLASEIAQVSNKLEVVRIEPGLVMQTSSDRMVSRARDRLAERRQRKGS